MSGEPKILLCSLWQRTSERADVDIYPFGPDAAPLCGEVKGRGKGAGFATLERWLGDNDVLFLRRITLQPSSPCPGAPGNPCCRGSSDADNAAG
jgi:hypothetical protein